MNEKQLSPAQSGHATPCGCACSHHTNDEANFRRKKIVTGVSLLLVIIAAAIEHFFESWYYLAVVLAIIVLFLTAIPIFRGAYYGLRNGEVNVNELVCIAILGAVVLGEFVIAAEVAVIITIGEFIELWAYNRSRRDIASIVSNNPRYGYRITDGADSSSHIEEVSVDEITIGDTLLIRPGDVVSADGIVLGGSSYLDESCLTGESIPQEKKVGDMVYSGSINYDGALTITVTKNPQDSTYAKIVALVREAGERRPPTRLFINQFAHVYTPLVLIIAIVILLFTGDPIRAITVFIVACPCALLLATPSVVLTAIGSAAKKGILIKSGEMLEICSSVSVVLFDKTGTLTSGKMEIEKIVPLSGNSEKELLHAAGAAESTSSHPIAQAIIRRCKKEGIELFPSGEHIMHPGLGVQTTLNGSTVYAGSKTFLAQMGISLPQDAPQASGVDIWVARDGNILGSLWISDTIRPESENVVQAIQKHGIKKIGIVTGDSSSSVSQIAEQVGLSKDLIRSGMVPESKRQFIEQLQHTEVPENTKEKRAKREIVCFVGDGTNDGPALAQADIGVSIASRSDTVALETAHVVLMREGLSQLPTFLTLGMRSSKTITSNVILALIINLIMIVLAAEGWLTPATGAIGHQLGTIVVLLNSARLAVMR